MSLCKDCKKENPDQFMAKDSIWLSVARDDEILCLDCFQKRLNRELTPEDFPWDMPLNMENDQVRLICGFKPLTEEEKEELKGFLSKRGENRLSSFCFAQL
jgi:hypothetical protein